MESIQSADAAAAAVLPIDDAHAKHDGEDSCTGFVELPVPADEEHLKSSLDAADEGPWTDPLLPYVKIKGLIGEAARRDLQAFADLHHKFPAYRTTLNRYAKATAHSYAGVAASLQHHHRRLLEMGCSTSVVEEFGKEAIDCLSSLQVFSRYIVSEDIAQPFAKRPRIVSSLFHCQDTGQRLAQMRANQLQSETQKWATPPANLALKKNVFSVTHTRTNKATRLVASGCDA